MPQRRFALAGALTAALVLTAADTARCSPSPAPQPTQGRALRGETPTFRATTRICGKPERRSSGPTSSRGDARGHQGRRAREDPAQHPGPHANRATRRRYRRHEVDLARQPRSREGQHGVVRRRSARREDPAADAGGAGTSGRARRGTKAKRTWARRFVHRSQPLRPLHLARCAGLDDARHLRQLLRDRSGPRLRGHSLRDGPRSASDPARWQSASAGEHAQLHGRRARPLGR